MSRAETLKTSRYPTSGTSATPADELETDHAYKVAQAIGPTALPRLWLMMKSPLSLPRTCGGTGLVEASAIPTEICIFANIGPAVDAEDVLDVYFGSGAGRRTSPIFPDASRHSSTDNRLGQNSNSGTTSVARHANRAPHMIPTVILSQGVGIKLNNENVAGRDGSSSWLGYWIKDTFCPFLRCLAQCQCHYRFAKIWMRLWPKRMAKRIATP